MKGLLKDSFYSVLIMDHLVDLQCSSSTPEASNQNNFLLNPRYLNLESPPVESQHVGHSLSDPMVLLHTLPPRLSLEDYYSCRNLLFPPKSSESLCCHSVTSIVNNRPVESLTRLNQSCPQLTTQNPSNLTDNFHYQLPYDSQYLPVTSVVDHCSHMTHFYDSNLRGHVDNTAVANSSISGVENNNCFQNVLAPIVTENSSAPISAPSPSKQIVRSGLFCPNYFMGSSKEDPRHFIQDFHLGKSSSRL